MLDSQMKLVGQHKRMILVSTRPNQVIKLDSDEPQIWFKTRNHLQVQKLVDVVHTPKKRLEMRRSTISTKAQKNDTAEGHHAARH